MKTNEKKARPRTPAAVQKVTDRSKATPSRPTLERMLDRWPDTPRRLAEHLVEKYGMPQEATPSRFAWFDAAPWKRMIVYRDEVAHHFPKPHADLLEQVIDYRVPIERLADVARFHGSLVVDRTRGEVAARCDMEETNVLALNLMHDVVRAARTVEDARAAYAEIASGVMLSRPSALTAKLQFARQTETADPDDVVVAGSMSEQVVGTATELVGAKERS